MFNRILIAVFTLCALVMFLGACEYFEEVREELPEEVGGGEPPKPTVAPTATPKVNPVCTQTMRASDGPGGFLWKNGDRTGNVVVLLPSRFTVQFDSVSGVLRKGKREVFNFTGFSNGDRQTWRGSKPIDRYKNKSLVTAKEFKQECSWKLGNASRRND